MKNILLFITLSLIIFFIIPSFISAERVKSINEWANNPNNLEHQWNYGSIWNDAYNYFKKELNYKPATVEEEIDSNYRGAFNYPAGHGSFQFDDSIVVVDDSSGNSRGRVKIVPNSDFVVIDTAKYREDGDYDDYAENQRGEVKISHNQGYVIIDTAKYREDDKDRYHRQSGLFDELEEVSERNSRYARIEEKKKEQFTEEDWIEYYWG